MNTVISQRLPPPLWNKLQSCLPMWLASLRQQNGMKEAVEKDNDCLKWRATPHVATEHLKATRFPMWPMVAHYMERTMWDVVWEIGLIQLLWSDPTWRTGCHIRWKVNAVSEGTMCRRWPRESDRPLLKYRCCCPLRSRKWSRSLCRWMTIHALPFAFP